MAINKDTQKINLLQEKETLIKELSFLGLYDEVTKTFTAKKETGEKDETADFFESFTANDSTGLILKERLVDVENALIKIDTDMYGICEKSGEEIEEDRLIANPAARTCKREMNNE